MRDLNRKDPVILLLERTVSSSMRVRGEPESRENKAADVIQERNKESVS